MSSDEFERLKFFGTVEEVVEKDLAASLSEDNGATVERLYAAYQAAGKPRKARQWIREQLAGFYKCANERPVWVGPTPQWPYLDGKPMIFIKQFEVGRGAVESNELAAGDVIYVFGIRVQTENGIEMRYRVVAQDPGTRYLAVTPA